MPPGPTRAASPWGTTTTAIRRCTHWRTEFVLADNFFQGAFGGSFLNHQYLICACAPEYPNADTAPAKPPSRYSTRTPPDIILPRLKAGQEFAASALDGPPKFVKSGNITPANYFGDGKFYAVNTMQPAYQPSGNEPAAADCRRALRRSRQAHHLAAADQADHRRSIERKDTSIGPGMPAPGTRRSPTAAARRAAAPSRFMRPRLPAAVPISSRITSPSITTSASIRRRHAEQRAAHLKDYGELIADARPAACPRWCSTSRKAI